MSRGGGLGSGRPSPRLSVATTRLGKIGRSMTRAFDSALRDSVAANLARFERHERAEPGLSRAAVAATLVGDAEGRACFLITPRSAGLCHHPRDWALPGRRLHPREAPHQTPQPQLHVELP